MRKFGALAGALVMGLAAAPVASAQTVPLVYAQPLGQNSVAMVQQRLRQEGVYGGRIDGQWGSDSVAALQQFQETHGLQPNGQLNQATLASLGLTVDSLLGPATVAAAPPVAVAPTTPSPRGVQEVQARLRQLGFYHGAIDGVWGAETQSAISAFQQGRGLQPNGQLNPTTVAALGINPNDLFAAR
jgi:peptidoglycan hydrolase-like protein with peptidoglycan-binding domain